MASSVHCLLLVACSLALLILSTGNPVFVEDRLIGWQGEKSRSNPAAATNSSKLHGPPRIYSVAWQPRVFIWENFLTDAECDHLKKLAMPQMRRSTVVPEKEGDSDVDPVRTSYGMFIRRLADNVVKGVAEKVAQWTHIPAVHQEDLQILRYAHGQKYEAHYDSLVDDTPRTATVLLYLSDVEEGGETAFPQTTDEHWTDPSLADKFGPFSDCAKGHVAMRPKKGDALLFWSYKPDGKTEDTFSEHAGCPVTKGVKWTATAWVHTRPFHPEWYGQDEENPTDPGICADGHASCDEWARDGECEKNAEYMWKGSSSGDAGICRKACKKCKACPAGSIACYNQLRKEAGFLELSPEEYQLLFSNSTTAGTIDSPHRKMKLGA